MVRQRGFITLSLLVIGSLLVIVANYLLGLNLKQQESYRQEILLQQLRYLNDSLFAIQNWEAMDEGEKLIYEGVVDPGKYEVKTTVGKICSEDGFFEYDYLTSETPEHPELAQKAGQARLVLPSRYCEKAEIHSLYGKAIIGANYLTKPEQYIQAVEEVQVPAANFWFKKAGNILDEADALKNGFPRMLIYSDKGVLNLGANAKKKLFTGDAVIINSDSIRISDNCKFTGHVYLITDHNNITIGKNVQFAKVFLLTPGSVEIGAGCRLNGLAVGKTIKLLGKSTFTADASVVAPFTSAAFIN